MLFRSASKDEISEEEDDNGSEAGPARTMKVWELVSIFQVRIHREE